MALGFRNFVGGVVVCFLFGLSTLSAQVFQPKADVMFLLDTSDTVGSTSYDALKTFVTDVVRQWDIGPDKIQVAVTSYGQGVRSEIDLDDSQDLQDLLQKINTVPFRGGSTDVADALKYAHETGFSSVHGARPDVPHVIIHVTDRPAADPKAALTQAEKAFDKGIVIYNIPIGQGTDNLHQLTSDPQSRYLLPSDSYYSLTSMVPTVSSRINNEVPISSKTLPAPNSCLQMADLVFIVDSSSSVGQNDFQHLEDFLKDFIIQLPVGQNDVRVGLVQYANHPSLEFPLDMYSERLSVMKAIDNLRFLGGGSNTGDAINYAASELFAPKTGARYGVPHIAVVITDGRSTDPTLTTISADKARQQGIGLISVGVGSSVNFAELESISDDPDSGHLFQSRSYKDLKSLSKQILDAACKMTNVVTPPPTLPPGVTTPDPCHDELDNCAYYPKDTCKTYEGWARQKCKKYCGFCEESVQVVPCDDDVDCTSYGTYICDTPNYAGWVRTHCKRYCGFCPRAAETLGYFGKCFYKGKEYSHGEKWLDGCDYECVCESGTTGTYRCFNRCPVYSDLPSDCTLIARPNECCLQPVCDFKQKITTTQGSGKGINPQGIDMCEYGGLQYYNGQSWDVGCDLRCTCTNAQTGTYICQAYCPTYEYVPSECQLVKRPGGCCAEPVCEFKTLTGIFTGTGTTSGNGIGSAPPARICADKLANCAAYGRAACREYPDWAHTQCAAYCDVCEVITPAPDANDACIYDGQLYKQGESWTIGCDLECTCEVPAYGYYICNSKCPTYSDNPSGCTTQRVIGECCPQLVCTNGRFNPSAMNITSVGNGGGITLPGDNGTHVDILPTVPSNTSMTTVNFGSGNRLDGCLFQGRVYVQSQQWQVGCDLSCVCLDASAGKYECRERCPKYENVPSTCKFKPDPSDTCCTYPADCGSKTGYVAIPVYPKTVTNIGAVMSPSISDLIYGHYTTKFTVTFSAITVQAPTTPGPKQNGGGYCIYKKKQYNHGETWEDGCLYNCVCEDGSTGSYRCVEKCEHYVDLPRQYCYLETDPFNPCCQRPVCNFTAGHDIFVGQRNGTLPPTQSTIKPNTFLPESATPAIVTTPTTPTTTSTTMMTKTTVITTPKTTTELTTKRKVTTPSTTTTTTTTTVAPVTVIRTTQVPLLRPMCQYNGQSYFEGQSWYDGCNYRCTCDDASENDYTCLTRCPSFSGNFTNCQSVPDPEDPQCCTVPQCQGVALPPGVFTGTKTNDNRDKCVYKSVEYQDGDVWDDGCQLQCECVDSASGFIQCTDKCPKLSEVPPGCILVQDFANPCCKVPQCAPTPSYQPGITPSPNEYCVYNQAKYYKGQMWNDGCSLECRCEDPKANIYNCIDRCPTYSAVPPGCTLMPDPRDPCCLKPDCVPPPNAVPSPTDKPMTIAPAIVTGKVPQPGKVPNLGYCIYDGNQYSQGDTWFDGCDFSCKCEDSAQGLFTCTERCPSYAALPPQCKLVKDASNPCCEMAVCDPDWSTPAPVARTTLVPGQVTTQLPLPKDVCVYDGMAYSQGQVWYDGCQYKCVCEDAPLGIYRCSERCIAQPPLPQNCSMVPDPRDPVCCEVAKCDIDPMAPEPGNILPTLVPGKVTGQQVTPSPLPGDVPKIVGCLYDGVRYSVGQRWADGCEFECVCEDGITGKYTCTERCPNYGLLPPQCVSVPDPADPCCKRPYCDPNISTPPTLASQSTLVPGYKQPACVYNGVPYSEGSYWNDGCELRCVCENEQTGDYRCEQRCQQYDQVPTGCQLAADPDDSCCQVVICTPDLLPTPSPQSFPVPYPIPVKVPGKVTGQTVNNFGSGCVYQSKVYQTGSTWDDGCDYICKCLNADTGVYQCEERCAEYMDIPTVCQKVRDPSDLCCEIPKCPPPTTVAPTPGPGVTTAVPGILTPGPRGNMCQYDGKQYLQDQIWYDGCDSVCECLDAAINFTQCQDRCASYDNIPPECRLVADPQDPLCCRVPQCTPVTPPPTPPLPSGAPTPTPTVYTNIPGIVTGKAPKPTPTPNPQTGVTMAPDYACVYKGQDYKTGQKWQDGCEYNCECINATIGFYKCEERCSSYPYVPPLCQLVPDPNDYCCRLMQCDYSKPTPYPFQPTPNPLQPGNITTLAPDPNKPLTLRPDLAFCVYQGVAYRQGATWNVGCEKTCRCDDASTNYYSCFDRCPIFGTTPPNCKLETSPQDACCLTLSCVPDPTAVVTAVPGIVTGNPGPGVPVAQSACVYNGITYKTRDKWYNGCNYLCECLDDSTGQYKCTERCTKYLSVPAGCVLVPDPADMCCQVPQCSTTVAPPTGDPNTPSTLTPPPVPLPTPPADVCIYNGKQYTEGQRWYDGCTQLCVCENARLNFTRCSQRCAVFADIPPGCVLVPDPSDPVCCKQPRCDNTPGVNTTGYTGKVTGFGTLPTTAAPTPYTGAGTPSPTPLPGIPIPPVKNNSCVYKGVQYTEGQRWRDGCDYNCVCVDGSTGQYECLEICPRYANTAGCPLVRDRTNPCCLKPDCTNVPTTTPLPGPVPMTNSPLPTPYPVQHPTLAPNTAFCVYNGLPYKQFDVWMDGCDLKCRCEDTAVNQINCDQRCPVYPSIPAGCTMITDPSDACCQIPSCVPPPGQTPSPTGSGLYGVVTGKALPDPGFNKPQDVCIYHGTSYTQGDTWEDGCYLNCTCIDGTTGSYFCKERCQRYPTISPSCYLEPDPNDACCERLVCQGVPTPSPQSNTSPASPSLPPSPGVPTLPPSPGVPTLPPSPGVPTLPPSPGSITQTATPTPGPQRTTLQPPKLDVCEYKGQYYRQDQTWYDGCSLQCVCDNATLKHYSCRERCARFTITSADCVMVPDPSDPSCCTIPSCPIPQTGPVPQPGPITLPFIPGQFVGIGKLPSPTPQPTPPGYTGTTAVPPTVPPGCVYKGTLYKEGEIWTDGCDYNCICEDGITGQYTCTEICANQNYNLPAQCALLPDPNNTCCEVPFCDFINPTPFPSGIPTLQPGKKPLNVSGFVNGFKGSNDQCVYKGVFYNQDQTWNDGCEATCTCDNALTGFFTCRERCPQYFLVPNGCQLVTDPNDSCCVQPVCPDPPTPTPDPNPAPQPTAKNGSTLVPPTNPPVYVASPKPPATFTGTGGSPQVQPGGTNPDITGSNNVCIFKGSTYQQGEQFEDGCQYNCTCEDAVKGVYRCTERCPQYVNLPAICRMVKDPNDACCEIPVCDGSAPTPTSTTPTAVKTTPLPTTVPTTPTTTMTTTTATTTPPDVCIFYGQYYQVGASWKDPLDCGRDCDCETAAGVYSCHNTCPVYAELPSYCQLVPSQSSSCCKEPSCVVNGQNVTTKVPLGTVSVTGGSSGRGRNYCMYQGTRYEAGDSWVDGCDLSCSCSDTGGYYTCVSRCPQYPSGTAFTANCTTKAIPGYCCPILQCNVPGVGKYSPIPDLGAVPNMKPAVPGQPTAVPTATPTPAPQIWVVPGFGSNLTSLPGGGAPLPTSMSALTGIRDKCIYGNQMYNEGEEWSVDCDVKCKCLNAFSGFYQCTHTCTIYEEKLLPAGCTLVKDGCCNKPQCQGQNGQIIDPIANPAPSLPIVGSPGKGFTGMRPGFVSGNASTQTGFRSGCVYRTSLYQAGEKWIDGCQYECECVDAQLGLYRCQEQCLSYPNMPATCRMESIPNECCDEVVCQIPTTTPATTVPTTASTTPTTVMMTTTKITGTPTSDQYCHDVLSNCKAYGVYACQGEYEPWARKNCNETCGFCVPAVTTPPPACEDELDCTGYGPDMCTSFARWAEINCRKFCGYCGPNASTLPPITTTQGPTTPVPTGCADKKRCDEYGSYICTRQDYGPWVLQNCPAYCGLCGASPTTSNQPVVTPMTSMKGWTMLLKGLSGVPGDLGQIWTSEQPLNAMNPAAMTLTPDFKGHYKADITWSQCQFDEVKVSMFKDGLEVGNIVFDARGADKTSWFTPQRILSSTWNDIKTAQQAMFSVSQSPLTGREFTVSKTSGCDGQGWLFISTSTTCAFEQNGAAPKFFFSKAPGASNLANDQLGEADVFAVFGKGGNCGSGMTTTMAPPATTTAQKVCIYKNQTYNQGETWQDGCDLECNCLNATSGRYVCNSKCPTYPSLSSQCTLITKPGECCAEPICNGIIPQKGCYYRGTAYSEGAQWTDGCDFDCTCLDGATGDFKCKSICPRWNLPAECTLQDPASGFCCKTPKCPFQWVPPAGYVPR